MDAPKRRLVFLLLACLVAYGQCAPWITTYMGENKRYGWYPNEGTKLSPDNVRRNDFGVLWKTPVSGQVYTTALVYHNKVYVGTTKNDVYALDAKTGKVVWKTNLGNPWPAFKQCTDLIPVVGITATPVIDPYTNQIFVHAKTLDAKTKETIHYLFALDADTGKKKGGNWPVKFGGKARNAARIKFNPLTAHARVALLLLNNFIYVTFASHCDVNPYWGWIFGINKSGTIVERWVANTGPGIGRTGIWQVGNGLVVDRPNSLLFLTGNGVCPTGPKSGKSANGLLGHSAVRLNQISNGQLHLADWFTPSNCEWLDKYDADFGSTGPTVYPKSWGAKKDLVITIGKEGKLNLLDANNLGGFRQGTGGGDAVYQSVAQFRTTFAKPAIWPGYMAEVSKGDLLRLFKLGQTGDGKTTFIQSAQSKDIFGGGTSSPIVTSKADGSNALIWLTWMSKPTGYGAELRAYDVNAAASGVLTPAFRIGIGRGNKYTLPTPYNGRVYLGTMSDLNPEKGYVYAFGSPTQSGLDVAGPDFPKTTVGKAVTKTYVVRSIAGSVTVKHLTIAGGDSDSFRLGKITPALPTTVTTSKTVKVYVTFNPDSAGTLSSNLHIVSSIGQFNFGLIGEAEANGAQLVSSPDNLLDLGGAILNRNGPVGNIVISNAGSGPLTITGYRVPGRPWKVRQLAKAGTVLTPGKSFTLQVSVSTAKQGSFNGDVTVKSTGGSATVGLTVVVTAGPKLTVPKTVNFGNVAVGTAKKVKFFIANTGKGPLICYKSKPPAGQVTVIGDGFDEGEILLAGKKEPITVQLKPTQKGPVLETWILNGNDGTGIQIVKFVGRGV